jgi:HSP20 family molecular chaperone IbpA
MSALREALRSLPEAVYADLLEGDNAYVLVIDMPGTTAETVDVRVDGTTIVVEARREKDVPPEFRYVDEERSLFLDTELPLPPDATASDASGTVDDGVLELRLPKRSAATTVPIDD